MESVEKLKGLIGELRRRIDELNAEITAEKRALSHLYAELFYAENGMEEGQHFMFEGKEYVEIDVDIWGCVVGRYITKSGTVSLMRSSIPHSDFPKIQPLPMEK